MMTKTTSVQFFYKVALGLAALILTLGFGGPASANCEPFPKIPLWNALTHDFVRLHVNENYYGDWQAYIEKLQGYKIRLRAIQKRGTGAVVTWKNRNIRLEGPSIATFVKLLERRIEVTRCLSGVNDGPEDIANFSTAAGGGPADTGPRASPSGQCGPVPNVEWWKFKTHGSIAGYVNRRYRGDWEAYIGTWKRRLGKLRDIYGRGSSAVANNGTILEGAILAGYIGKLQDRITVTRCLAKSRERSRI